MKQDQFKKPVGVLLLTLFCFMGFALRPGGDMYEIYLNKKLLLKQFVTQAQGVQNIAFNKMGANDQLTIYYHHCGQTGRNRSLTLKDNKGHTLKEWKFADVQGVDQGMTVSVKEVLQLTKASGEWSLVYCSKELPQGRALASIGLPSKNLASVESFEFILGASCFWQSR